MEVFLFLIVESFFQCKYWVVFDICELSILEELVFLDIEVYLFFEVFLVIQSNKVDSLLHDSYSV